MCFSEKGVFVYKDKNIRYGAKRGFVIKLTDSCGPWSAAHILRNVEPATNEMDGDFTSPVPSTDKKERQL